MAIVFEAVKISEETYPLYLEYMAETPRMRVASLEEVAGLIFLRCSTGSRLRPIPEADFVKYYNYENNDYKLGWAVTSINYESLKA